MCEYEGGRDTHVTAKDILYYTKNNMLKKFKTWNFKFFKLRKIKEEFYE